MKADEFRQLALCLPEAIESEHMNHPDFRVGGKIFATIGPDADWGMVKLTPDQQALYLSDEPESFTPANGAWGRGGATIVQFDAAKQATVAEALRIAWTNTAPKKLVAKHKDRP